MLGGRTPQVNNQDQIGQSGKLMLLIDEVKNTAIKRLPWLSFKTICPNCIALCEGKQGTHSGEAKTLAPVFEKSAIELKPKQKLLKCKSIEHITTLNVGTLNRIGQQLAVNTLLPLVFQCLDPIVLKVINRKYDIIQWTFKSIVIFFPLSYPTCKKLELIIFINK